MKALAAACCALAISAMAQQKPAPPQGDLGTAVRSDTLNRAPSFYKPGVHSQRALNATDETPKPGAATPGPPVISVGEELKLTSEQKLDLWRAHREQAAKPLGDLAREWKREKQQRQAASKVRKLEQ